MSTVAFFAASVAARVTESPTSSAVSVTAPMVLLSRPRRESELLLPGPARGLDVGPPESSRSEVASQRADPALPPGLPSADDEAPVAPPPPFAMPPPNGGGGGWCFRSQASTV
jgi:hypothetical protein